MTEIHLFKKTSEAFPKLKKLAAKLKAQKNLMQKFKDDNGGKFNFITYKKWMQTEKIQ